MATGVCPCAHDVYARWKIDSPRNSHDWPKAELQVSLWGRG